MKTMPGKKHSKEKCNEQFLGRPSSLYSFFFGGGGGIKEAHLFYVTLETPEKLHKLGNFVMRMGLGSEFSMQSCVRDLNARQAANEK